MFGRCAKPRRQQKFAYSAKYPFCFGLRNSCIESASWGLFLGSANEQRSPSPSHLSGPTGGVRSEADVGARSRTSRKRTLDSRDQPLTCALLLRNLLLLGSPRGDADRTSACIRAWTVDGRTPNGSRTLERRRPARGATRRSGNVRPAFCTFLIPRTVRRRGSLRHGESMPNLLSYG